MRTLAMLGFLLLFVAAPPLHAGDGPEPYAKHLQVGTPALRLVGVEPGEGDPIPFTLVVEVELPELGWTLEVLSADAPDATGRIVVKIAARRPEGMLPQVMTWTPVRVPVGPLRAGQYLLDVFLESAHARQGRVGVLFLEARS